MEKGIEEIEGRLLTAQGELDHASGAKRVKDDELEAEQAKLKAAVGAVMLEGADEEEALKAEKAKVASRSREGGRESAGGRNGGGGGGWRRRGRPVNVQAGPRVKSAGPPNQKSVSENGHAKRAGLQAEVGSGGGGAGRSAGKQRRRRGRGRRRTTGKSLRVSPRHRSTAWLEIGQEMDTTHTTKGGRGGEKDGDEGRREPQISGSPQCSIAPHTCPTLAVG